MHPTRPTRQRSPLNNPTERIQRLLDSFDAVQAYYESLEDALANHAPEVMATLPPQPDISAFLLEAQRQQFTYGKTIKARRYMARMRAASEEGPLMSNAKQQLRAIARNGLTEERKQAILAEIDDEPIELQHGIKPPDQELVHKPLPIAQLVEQSAANDEKIGLPPGVSIEPSEDALALEEDLKEGKIF